MENTQDNMDVEKVESDEEENGKENYSQEDDDSSESETEDSCEEGSEEEDSGDEELEEGDDNAEESDESEDDDWETDNGEDERAEDEETENEAGPSSTQQSIEDSSDSGGDDSIDRCPICLCKLRDQDVGTPESCDHTFCLECIQEWSKNVNTCPVDRQVYRLILAKHSQDGVIFKRIPVENKSLQLEEEAVEDQTFCEVCGQANREDRLLLCDSCDLGYHCECLTPALRSVPVGEWFCPTCTQAHEHATQQFNITTPRRRRIARTLVSERVRAVIAEARARGGRRVIVSDSESEEEYLQPEEEVAVASTSRPRGRSTTGTRRRTTTPKKRKTVRRKTTKKRKTTRKRKRKAPKKEKAASSKTATSKKTTKRRRKRRTKKRKGKRLVRTKSTTPSTVKKRLAGRLGLSKPPAGRSIPMMKEHVERSLDSQRTDLGLSSLSILGHRDDLDPYYSDEDVGSGGLGVIQPRARNNIYSRAALKSCCTIPYTRPRNPVSSQPRPPSPKLADEAGGFDLLGSIMMGTSLLFTKSENVIIRRDGSLEQKKWEKGSLTVNNNKTNFGKRCNDPHTPSDSPQDNGGSQQGSSPQSPSSTTSDQQGQDAGNSNDGGDAEGGSVGSSDNAGDDEGVMDLTPQHNDSPSYDKEESNGEKNGQDNEKQDSDNEKQDSDNEKQDSDNEKQDSDNEKQVSDNEKQDSDNEKQDSDNEKQDSDSDNDNESVVKREKEESEASNDKDQSDNEMQDPEKPQADDSGKEENEDDKKEVNIQSNDEINESTDQQQAQLKGQETSPSKKSRGEELYDPLEADSDDMDIESQNSNEGGDQNKKSMEQDDPLEAAMEDCIDEVDPKKESFENQEQEDDIKYEERDDQEGDESHEAQNEGDDENQEEELEGDGSEGDMIEEEEEDTKTPISELPRIPKIRKKEVDTEGEGEGPAPHRSVLDRLGSRAEPQVSSYPHWEKRERYREREGKERREKDRGEEDDYRGNDADDIERHRHKHKHRDRDRDRDKERSYDREKKSKDRDRERERARDSGVEELGSSSGKRKRRRHSRSRSKDRRRDRSERSDRSRSHSRDHRRRSRDRSRDRKRDKNRGGSNERERKHKRRSRSRSPRSHHRHGDREDRGDSHRDRSGDRGVDDYKASVKLFSQSLKEASEGDNSSGRRFKLKRNFYQGQNMEQVQEVPKKSRFEDIEIESPRPIVPPPPREEIQRRLESRVEPIINKLRPHRAPPYVDENSMSPDITEPAEVLQFSPKPPTKEAKEPSSPPPRTPPHRSPPRKSPFKKDIEKSRSSFEKSRPPFKSEVQKVVTSSKVDDSYDPSEPTEDLTPEMSPEMNSPTHAEQPLMNVPTSLMAAMPPTSRDDLVKMSSLGKPLDMHHQPGPRVAGPTNMMLHPMRMGMLQPGMPHGGQQPLILNHPMLVNAPPPPFTRGLHHLGPARIRWPPNVLIQNRLHGPGSQNGMQHRPGERIMLENPPLPGMRPGMHRGPPPPPGMPPGMSERREMASAPPPLPAKALQEMEQISQLLNAQAKLAQMMPGGRPMRPPLHHGNVFKVPMAPSHNMDARHQNKPSADNAETMEVVDMDVASPLSDDDLVMSFSPPPEKQDKDHDRKDKDKKGESSKSILSELNKEDEVPTSAVELDKHQKANKFMKKLNRQERVVEEVKLAIKPHYSKGRIDKDEYKEIMRKAVPKICHSKSGDINPVKIRSLVEAYVEKIRKMKKYMAKKDPGQQANGIQKPKQ